jgi:hypothetical protein
MARELRPGLSRLEPNSLVVTAVAGPLHETSPHLGYVDLIDHAMRHGTNASSQALLQDQVDAALSEGRQVYYIYSRWEGGADFQWDGRDNFVSFFETVRQNFTVTEIFDTQTLNIRRFSWTLYSVGARPSPKPPAVQANIR